MLTESRKVVIYIDPPPPPSSNHSGSRTRTETPPPSSSLGRNVVVVGWCSVSTKIILPSFCAQYIIYIIVFISYCYCHVDGKIVDRWTDCEKSLIVENAFTWHNSTYIMYIMSDERTRGKNVPKAAARRFRRPATVRRFVCAGWQRRIK